MIRESTLRDIVKGKIRILMEHNESHLQIRIRFNLTWCTGHVRKNSRSPSWEEKVTWHKEDCSIENYKKMKKKKKKEKNKKQIGKKKRTEIEAKKQYQNQNQQMKNKNKPNNRGEKCGWRLNRWESVTRRYTQY